MVKAQTASLRINGKPATRAEYQRIMGAGATFGKKARSAAPFQPKAFSILR
jgi:hypothetical protein